MYEDCDSDSGWDVLYDAENSVGAMLSGKENGELLGDVEEVSCKMITGQRLGQDHHDHHHHHHEDRGGGECSIEAGTGCRPPVLSHNTLL